MQHDSEHRCLHSQFCIQMLTSVFEVQKAGYKVVNEVSHDVDAIGMFTGTKEP